MKDWKYFWHVSAIFCAMWVARFFSISHVEQKIIMSYSPNCFSFRNSDFLRSSFGWSSVGSRFLGLFVISVGFCFLDLVCRFCGANKLSGAHSETFGFVRILGLFVFFEFALFFFVVICCFPWFFQCITLITQFFATIYSRNLKKLTSCYYNRFSN